MVIISKFGFGGGGPGGGVDSVTATDSTITVGGTPADPTIGINLAQANFWTGTQTLGNGMVARNAVQDATISTGIFSRLSSTAQVRIGHTSSYSGVRIDNPVGSIARFTSAQGQAQFGTDAGNGNSTAIIQGGVERFRIQAGTMENMSTGTLTSAQHGYTRTGNNYVHNITTGGNYQFNINGVTSFTVQAAQAISPRFLASGFTQSAATASFRGAAGNSSALYYPGGTRDQNLTEVFKTGTGEVTLFPFTVLAQEINRATGQGVVMKAFGRFNNPSVATRIRLRFDGNEVFNSGDLNGLVTTETWYMESVVNRLSADNIVICSRLMIDGLPPIVQTDDLGVTMTGAVDFNLTGEGGDSEMRKIWGKIYYDPMT